MTFVRRRWKIKLAECLADERRYELFPAWIIVGGSYLRKPQTHHEQDLNLCWMKWCCNNHYTKTRQVWGHLFNTYAKFSGKLTFLAPRCTFSLPLENTRKPYDFLFSGGRERVHQGVRNVSSSENFPYALNI